VAEVGQRATNNAGGLSQERRLGTAFATVFGLLRLVLPMTL
jgi:hypothetical protein